MRGPDNEGLQYRAGTADKAQYTALTRHRQLGKEQLPPGETLVSANARLVDFSPHWSLLARWGGGEVASADGMPLSRR